MWHSHVPKYFQVICIMCCGGKNTCQANSEIVLQVKLENLTSQAENLSTLL